jgi:hypothetical protein
MEAIVLVPGAGSKDKLILEDLEFLIEIPENEVAVAQKTQSDQP